MAKPVAVGAGAGMAAAGLTAISGAAGLAPWDAIAPVAITVFCVVAALHYWKSQHAVISATNERVLEKVFRRIEDGLAETQGLMQLATVDLPFPLAFGGVNALTPDAAAMLAREVMVRRPRVVVELGSGVSTILVGCLLRRLGSGRVHALQHDPGLAAATRRQVAAAGLASTAEVLDAPLVSSQVDDRQYRWYAVPESVSGLDSIDLLIVDGPPQRIDPGGLPRYPALPFFETRLSDDAVVFVDDARRPSEMETVRLWLELVPGWEAQWVPTVRGTFILTRRPAVRP